VVTAVLRFVAFAQVAAAPVAVLVPVIVGQTHQLHRPVPALERFDHFTLCHSFTSLVRV